MKAAALPKPKIWPRPASHGDHRLAPFDLALVTLFLLGLYLGVSLQITPKVPLTCAPSGLAGIILLWRRRDQIEPVHLAGLLGILALYLASIMSATDYTFLDKRFTGLLQFAYSLVIAYALFVTLVNGERSQIAWILLGLCLFIIVGCLLENYGGLRVISDKFRERLYDAGQVYDADLRDQLLYGRVRPKLFTSEPSAVTFAFTHFCSVWLVVSPWRRKLLVYLALMGCGLFVMPGPTLMLMLLLTVPYLLFLSGGTASTVTRFVGAAALSMILVGAAIVIGQSFFAERLNELASGKDASFFYRFTGPMLVAIDVIKRYPWAGAGLTGEPFIADRVLNVYMNSAAFQAAWKITRIGDVLTNYFWLHWIYLGLVWGSATLVAISVWLRKLGVPSVLYCWVVWVILGQASGSYVGPRTWSVLLIAAATSILSAKSARRQLALMTVYDDPALQFQYVRA
jgi:TRAP-type mannitol/chloroaromatic compound transport system permease small subunit